MLNEADIKINICEAVVSLLKKEQALQGCETFSDLGLDILDMFELILKVEDVFMIEITDEEADSCVSIPTMISCVQQKLNNACV